MGGVFLSTWKDQMRVRVRVVWAVFLADRQSACVGDLVDQERRNARQGTT